MELPIQRSCAVTIARQDRYVARVFAREMVETWLSEPSSMEK
jgi:hypothetical protein